MMPITEVSVVTRIPDGAPAEDTERSTRRLYTLAELRDGKHIEDEPSDIITSAVSGAYERALEKIAEGNYELWEADGDWLTYIHEKAGITFDFAQATWDVSYHQGSMWFALPKGTDIDTPVFLRAMKDYFAGIDYRHDGIAKESWVVAPPYQRHKIDLRSKDAVIAREQGLAIEVRNAFSSSYGGGQELDLDYYYGDMTDEFKRDCNEFLDALNEEVVRLLREDAESVTKEDYILDQASENEWLFTKEGRFA